MGTPTSWILCNECKEPTHSESAVSGEVEYIDDRSIKITAWFCSPRCRAANITARAAPLPETMDDDPTPTPGNGTHP